MRGHRARDGGLAGLLFVEYVGHHILGDAVSPPGANPLSLARWSFAGTPVQVMVPPMLADQAPGYLRCGAVMMMSS